MQDANAIPVTEKPLATRWMPVVKVAAPPVVGAGLAIMPVPHGVPANAWHYFALFAAVIVGVITEPVATARSPWRKPFGRVVTTPRA